MNALQSKVRQTRKLVEKHEQNVRGALYLSILYEALSRYDKSGNAQQAEYRSMSQALLRTTMEKIADQASYLLLGRPVNDTLMQVGVRHAIAQYNPLGLLPKTSSVDDFISSIYTSRHESAGKSVLVRADIYDFSGRRLEASALCRDKEVVWISINGDDKALDAAQDCWRRNAAIMQGGMGPQVRNRLELQDIAPAGGRSLVIVRSEGKVASDELLIARFAEQFFEYWPHPTVRRFIERLDDDASWAGLDDRNADLPKFEFSNGGKKIRVQMPHSDQTDGMTVDLDDLNRQVDLQERDPNQDALDRKMRLSQQPVANIWTGPLATPTVEPTAVLGATMLASFVQPGTRGAF